MSSLVNYSEDQSIETKRDQTLTLPGAQMNNRKNLINPLENTKRQYPKGLQTENIRNILYFRCKSIFQFGPSGQGSPPRSKFWFIFNKIFMKWSQWFSRKLRLISLCLSFLGPSFSDYFIWAHNIIFFSHLGLDLVIVKNNYVTTSKVFTKGF